MAKGFRTLVTEVFPDDDPWLDEDTVFRVRSDLVARYEKPEAGSFPDSFELSGEVDEEFPRLEFYFVLSR